MLRVKRLFSSDFSLDNPPTLPRVLLNHDIPVSLDTRALGGRNRCARPLTDLRKCWRELVRFVQDGVFADCDAWAVEIASVLMAEFRADTGAFNAARIARLDSLLGRFGITPADRSRVTAIQPEKKNRFDDDWQ